MNGVSPRDVGAMSLFELFSTFAAMPKKARPMTDAEYDAGKDYVRSLKLPDVRV